MSPSSLLLLLLLCSSCCCAPHPDPRLRLLLRPDPLMDHKQDVSRPSLAQLLLNDLLQVGNEVLEEEDFLQADGQAGDVHVDLERAAAGETLLAPRERKAGCKNFFWKTFTSC
ncbi:somatostatin 1, tandem duplicate 1 [Neosynchiropus ocellatus]